MDRLEAARRAFDEYARLEPRLEELWERCREAGPPVYADEPEDAFDVDDFDVDIVAGGSAAEDWCEEDFFFAHVKSDLMLLVGVYRRTGPAELQTTKAYDAVYALLLEACCVERPAADDDKHIAP